MRQSNHFIWYIPFYSLLFLTFYTGIKFVFIFFFSTSFSPSFIFDLTPFFYFSGFEFTHLLFLSFVILFIDIYLHNTLSKKHLLFSFIPTGLLISGIGLRIAIYPFSLDMLVHYLLFGVLLAVLIIDHRLYLLVPDTFSHLSALERETIKHMPLPAFSSTKPSPVQIGKKGIFSSPLFSGLKSAINNMQEAIQKRLQSGKARATLDQGAEVSQTEQLDNINISDTHLDRTSSFFKHPIEKMADHIPSTKQLLGTIGPYADHLRKIDNNIEKTKCSEEKISEFMQSLYQELPEIQTIEPDQYNGLLQSISESAVIVSRGIVKGVNHSFVELIGRPTADIINHNFIEFIAPEGLQNFKSHCLQRLGGESSFSFPLILKTKKNQKLTKEVVIKRVYSNDEEFEILLLNDAST